MKKCPLCEGFSYVGKNKTIDITHEICLLRQKGLTIREIGKLLNKGTTTVFYHLKKGERIFSNLLEETK